VQLITFLLILSVLVLIHEFGHYISARVFGLKVEEFGFGFPPRLFKKKIGDTTYTLNALPFGGFVKIYGEDSLPADKAGLSGKLEPGSFQNLPVFIIGQNQNIIHHFLDLDLLPAADFPRFIE